MTKKILFPVFGHLMTLFAFAQNTNYQELFRVSYQQVGSAEFNNSSTQLDQRQFSILGGYGLTLNDNDDQLNFGVGYSYLNFENDSEPNAQLNIHDLSVGLDYQKNWGLYWASTFSLGLANVSDFQTEASSAYQTLLSVLFHHGKSESLIWTFGLLYSDQPFGPWIFPILGVDWQINSNLYFSSLLFNNLYLEHTLVPYKLYWGLDIAAEGQSFVLSDYQGQTDSYITSFSEEAPYFPFNYRIFIDYYLPNGLVFYGKFGYLASRGFRHWDVDGNRISTLYDQPVKAGLNGEIGIAFRVRNF